MSIKRYSVIEKTFIDGKLLDVEVSMVRASAHDNEMATLREELTGAMRWNDELVKLLSREELENWEMLNLLRRVDSEVSRSLSSQLWEGIAFLLKKYPLGSKKPTPRYNPYWPARSAEELERFNSWLASGEKQREPGVSE